MLMLTEAFAGAKVRMLPSVPQLFFLKVLISLMTNIVQVQNFQN